MGRSIEVTAKRVSDAINEGLATLDKTIDEVEVKILTQGGLFRKAKVMITVIGNEPPVAAPAPQSEVKLKTDVKENNGRPPLKENAVSKREGVSGKAASSAEKREKPFKPAPPPQRQARKPEPALENKPEPKERKEDERVRSPITEVISATANLYLSQLLEKMGVAAKIDQKIENGELHLEIKTDSSIVIGYRGETLDAIEYLVSIAVNKEDDKYYKISVNCGGYREKREAVLRELAVKMANKCIRTNHKVVLEPMNSSGRRIIHAALAGNDKVVTRSEGHEPNRHVVILAVRNHK